MEAMRQSWTDDRLDNLNEKVDRRFDEVDRRFDELCRRLDGSDERFAEAKADSSERFAELKAGNGEMTSRLDSVQHAVIYLAVSLTAGIIAGFAAICLLIATQL
jgi:hypothetical protein